MLSLVALVAFVACRDLAAPTGESAFKPEIRLDYFDGRIPLLAGDSVIITFVWSGCSPYYWWQGLPTNEGATLDVTGAATGSLMDVCTSYPTNPLRTVATSDGIMTITLTDPRYGTSPPCYKAPDNPGYDMLCWVTGPPPDYYFSRVGFNILVLRPAPPDDSLKATCDSTIITRGNRISCRATPPQSEMIQSWEFVPSDPALGSAPIPRTDANLAAPWTGVMVSSGTVVVRTNSQSRSISIQVIDRDWNISDLPYNIVDKVDFGGAREKLTCNQGAVPWSDPPYGGVLGQTCSKIALPNPITPPSWFNLVSGGPNDGLSYSFAVPGRLKLETSVNDKALRSGSSFYNLQPNDGTVPNFCGKTWVANRLPLTSMHEGVGLSPHANSHAGNLPRFYTAYYVKSVEKMVRRGLPSPTDIRGQTIRSRLQAEVDSDDETHLKIADSSPYPWTFTCITQLEP